jgi:hypothetical protein
MIQELLDQIRTALGDRQVAYRRAFRCPPGEEVLADLARFCRATETTMHADARMQANAEGRREVWLHIQEHLQLTEEELWKLCKPRGVYAPE